MVAALLVGACTADNPDYLAALAEGGNPTAIPDLASSIKPPDLAVVDLFTPDLVVVTPRVVQLDARGQGLLTDDVIMTTGWKGAPPLSSVDGFGWNFMTSSFSKSVKGAAALPDRGLFPADANHPEVQLWYDDVAAVDNARVVAQSKSFSIATPPRFFKLVQIYCTSGDGDSDVTFTLNYADGTSTAFSVVIPDWWDNYPLRANQFALVDKVDRYDWMTKQLWSRAPFNMPPAFRIIGVNLAADPARVLTGVTVADAANDAGQSLFVFFGGVAIAP
jgi:hypothetical protein